MNKRQRKKKSYKCLDSEVRFLVKILLNDEAHNKYNPIIKCKGWRKMIKMMRHYSKKYDCDVVIKSLDWNTSLLEYAHELNKYDEEEAYEKEVR